MDTLVARYSQPAFQRDEPLEDDSQELMNPTGLLTTRFAMPPVAQVCASPRPRDKIRKNGTHRVRS